jgi:sigma-B regulation protein RsbU (phosphoserine phosphatase)
VGSPFGATISLMTSTVGGDQPADDRLRSLAALTDAALVQLDLEQLLAEMLDRVSDILAVDTAAVLLRDGSSDHLVATAARGLEAEVLQGVRIPMGIGFAGKIAAERRPVKLDRVDHTTVANPILWERGIKSMLGVPLLAGGNLLGVLHVGSLTTREFTSEDFALLQLAADRVALAVQTQLVEEERAAARALQRSLLPRDLPRLPTVEFAARYVPSAEIGVGGDWYDVFSLPAGHLCVAMGDVVGHGIQAATVMGRLRAAMRSNAMHTSRPEEVLELVDRELQHFEPGAMATVLLGVFEPSIEAMRLSSAGHPAPVLAVPDKRPDFVSVSTDPPLGIEPEIKRAATTVLLPPGATMLFFTDGLVEKRDASIDAGLGALLDVVATEGPNEVCATVMRKLVGDRAPRDDIALLAVQRNPDSFPGNRSGAMPSSIVTGPNSWWSSSLRGRAAEPFDPDAAWNPAIRGEGGGASRFRRP